MKSRAIVIVAVALLTVAAGAVVVNAGKQLKPSSETVTVGVGETGSAEARCKAGTKAVSGGFETEFRDPPADFPFVPIETSRPAGPRGWTSSGFNDGNAEGDLTSFAYCRGGKKLKAASETITIPVGQFATATATCPPGTKVFSGGLEAEPLDTVGDTPVLRVSESRRVGKRSWEASAFSNGNEPGDLSAYAYCRGGKKLKAKQVSTTISSDTTESADIQARCKRRQRVVSGGFGSPEDSGESTPRFLTSSKRGKRAWGVEAFVGGTGASIEFTAYAYCEKKR